MRVRFLTSIASADWAYGPGMEADFPDAQARAFIEGGICVAVERSVPVVETATRPAPRRK